MPNKALRWTGIPLRSIPASEFSRWAAYPHAWAVFCIERFVLKSEQPNVQELDTFWSGR